MDLVSSDAFQVSLDETDCCLEDILFLSKNLEPRLEYFDVVFERFSNYSIHVFPKYQTIVI